MLQFLSQWLARDPAASAQASRRYAGPDRASTSFVLALRAAALHIDPGHGTGADWHQSGNPCQDAWQPALLTP